MNTLKPCPFCGGEVFDNEHRGVIILISCKECPANVSFAHNATVDEAYAAWNRRTPVIPDTLGADFNDAAWAFVEALPTQQDRNWAISARIKPALRAFVERLLALETKL